MKLKSHQGGKHPLVDPQTPGGWGGVDVRTLTPSRNISERLSFVWEEMTQEWKSPAGFWVWGCCTSLRLFINTHTAARRCLNLPSVRTDSQTTEVSWTDWSFGVLRQNKRLFLGPWRVKLTVFIDNVTLFLKRNMLRSVEILQNSHKSFIEWPETGPQLRLCPGRVWTTGLCLNGLCL